MDIGKWGGVRNRCGLNHTRQFSRRRYGRRPHGRSQSWLKRRSRDWRRRVGIKERTFFRRKLACQVADGLLQIRIVARQAQRRAILHERFRERSAPVEHLGEAAYRRKVFRRALEDRFELAPCGIELLEFEQSAPERHARRQIARMDGQSRAAHLDGLLMLAGAPVLFGELRKGDRRGIFLDPPAKVFDSRVFRHARRAAVARDQGVIMTDAVFEAWLPQLSVTTNVAVYVPAGVKSCWTDAPVFVMASLKYHS